jgi:CDGSH-type Zn-finger protein
VNVIVVQAGGPYYCRGRIELLAADGTLVESVSEIWLCRCGQSRDKPRCDGNHALANFEDTTFSVATRPAPADPDAVLRIRARPNGPLKLEGPCEIHAPDGTVLMRGEETALCRCGHSGKRPFCDGTHRQVGFTA